MISLAKLLLDISSFELTMIECFTFWKIWDKKHIRVTLSIEIIGAQVSYSMKITLWIISASWRSDFGEEFIKFSGLINLELRRWSFGPKTTRIQWSWYIETVVLRRLNK
jgi:hypothetical protein